MTYADAYRERFRVTPRHDPATAGDCGHTYCRTYHERFGVWPREHPQPTGDPVTEPPGTDDAAAELLRRYFAREATLEETGEGLRALGITHVSIADNDG